MVFNIFALCSSRGLMSNTNTSGRVMRRSVQSNVWTGISIEMMSISNERYPKCTEEGLRTDTDAVLLLGYVKCPSQRADDGD
jgi:hypothetical protein